MSYKSFQPMLLHYLQGCFGFRKSNQAIITYFTKRKIPFSVGYYKAHGRWMRYLETGENTHPLVLFVHGAPGSSSAFLHFLSDQHLLAQAHMISVDRPGYGYSGFGKTVISLEQQAAMIHPLLKKNMSSRLPVLVGHSYGGTLIARFAMDYPEEAGALVMVAPAVDPRLEKVFGISYPANLWMFRWLIPTCLRVANEEKLGHEAQLNRMLPFWKNIIAPTTVIHGNKDFVAPVENASFVYQQIKNTKVELVLEENAGHLVPWEHPELIKEVVRMCLQAD